MWNITNNGKREIAKSIVRQEEETTLITGRSMTTSTRASRPSMKGNDWKKASSLQGLLNDLLATRGTGSQIPSSQRVSFRHPTLFLSGVRVRDDIIATCAKAPWAGSAFSERSLHALNHTDLESIHQECTNIQSAACLHACSHTTLDRSRNGLRELADVRWILHEFRLRLRLQALKALSLLSEIMTDVCDY